jgi:hypothetical protein
MDDKLKGLLKTYARSLSALFDRVGLVGSLDDIRLGARHAAMCVRLLDATDLNKALNLEDPAKLATRSRAIRTTVDQGYVVYEIELPDTKIKDEYEYWSDYYVSQFQDLSDRNGLEVGYKMGKVPVRFNFSQPHTIVAGGTGSGKTYAMYTILYALMSTYTPDELGIYIIDPHDEFSRFKDVAHIEDILHTETEISECLEMVEGLMDKRYNEKKNGKSKWEKRIVLLMDECQAPTALGVKDDNSLNKENIAVIRRIATEARKVNINLILGTQKPQKTNLPGILSQLNNRFVGLVSDANESAMLTGRPKIGAQNSTGQGDFIHVSGPIIERMQFAMVRSSDIALLPKKGIIKNVIDRPCDEINPELLAKYMVGLESSDEKYMIFKDILLKNITQLRKNLQ